MSDKIKKNTLNNMAQFLHKCGILPNLPENFFQSVKGCNNISSLRGKIHSEMEFALFSESQTVIKA